MSTFDALSVLIATSFLLLVYALCISIWRLCLSPLARFPGPKIAALTLWYECYYDVLKSGGGMYIWKIEEMHKKYGPVVRINPYELHIKDPDFYDQIYASAPSHRDKFEFFVKSPDSDNATGFTVDHDLHRLRREALGPFFSKRNVTSLESRIKAKTELMCQRLDEHLVSQDPINLTAASLALTMDILTDYAFADDFGLLTQKDFNIKWRDTILSIMQALPTVRHFKWFLRVVTALPASLARLIAPDLSQLIEWKERIRGQVHEVLSYSGVYQKTNREKRTIIEELRDNCNLPPQEKSLTRLADECSILLIAGSESPAKALAIIYYHLIANPSKLLRLRAELRTVLPDSNQIPSQATLEKIPYLSAVIHEGLRLHGGIVARTQRLAPNSLQYREWTIPARTPLSCISAFIHYDPEIYPEPRAFKPERWLEASPDGDRIDQGLKRHFVAFGRGTRNCLGYNLGYAMLYFSIATVVARFDMELFKTSFEDVNLQRDWTIPQPKVGSEGVQALVLRKVSD